MTDDLKTPKILMFPSKNKTTSPKLRKNKENNKNISLTSDFSNSFPLKSNNNFFDNIKRASNNLVFNTKIYLEEKLKGLIELFY